MGCGGWRTCSSNKLNFESERARASDTPRARSKLIFPSLSFFYSTLDALSRQISALQRPFTAPSRIFPTLLFCPPTGATRTPRGFPVRSVSSSFLNPKIKKKEKEKSPLFYQAGSLSSSIQRPAITFPDYLYLIHNAS